MLSFPHNVSFMLSFSHNATTRVIIAHFKTMFNDNDVFKVCDADLTHFCYFYLHLSVRPTVSQNNFYHLFSIFYFFVEMLLNIIQFLTLIQ